MTGDLRKLGEILLGKATGHIVMDRYAVYIYSSIHVDYVIVRRALATWARVRSLDYCAAQRFCGHMSNIVTGI